MTRAPDLLCVALTASILLAACATASREAAFRHEEVELSRARHEARIACETTVACDKAWARTRTFIETHSATRIVQADSSSIQTALPHAFGFVYLAATRSADEAGHIVIHLKAMCRGMYTSDGGAGLLYSTCARSIESAQAEFHAWVEKDR